MKRKALSMLLIICLLASIFPMPALAESQTETENRVKYSGTNGFGSLLADTLEKGQTADGGNSDYIITDITVSGDTANVDLEVIGDCSLVVALYDDEGLEKLASGYTAVSAGDTHAAVSLNSVPEHFLLKGFLLDPKTMQPLCQAFTTTLYTKEIQALLDMSTTDFDAGRVLNLDGDTDNNFAVYGEDVIVVEPKNHDENVVTTADENDGIYVIENADEQIQSLKPGEIFAYPYDKSNVLIVRVESISINGSTATIMAADIGMEDAFDFVKIDTEDNTANIEVDTSQLEEGIEYQGLIEDTNEPVTYAADFEAENKYSLTYKINKKLGSDDNYVRLDGSIALKLGVKVQCYMAWESSYLKSEFSYSLNLQGKISGQISIAKISLGEYGFSPIPGLYIGLTPSIVLKASAELSLSAKVSGTIAFQADLENGVQNLSKAPSVSHEWKFNGKIFLGLSLEPNIKIITEYLVKASAAVTAGVEISGTVKAPSGHVCKQCLDGAVDGKIEFSAKVNFLKRWEFEGKIDYTQHIFDFYYSFDYKEWGVGSCPHISGGEGGGGESSGGGGGGGGSKPPYEIASGFCGDRLTWLLTSEGRLNINGTGPMTDYDLHIFYGDGPGAPWYNNRYKITDVYIGDGVTHISNAAFAFCPNLRSITIPASVTSIGNNSFYECTGLVNITIPNGVVSIGWSAFEKCTKLKSISIPGSVTSIGSSAFQKCKSLESIDIPSSITTISSHTFMECDNLKTVKLPGTLQNINFCAFAYCYSLSSIKIPASVVNIEQEAFLACHSLMIDVDNSNPYYSTLDGVLFDKSRTFLHSYSKDKICPQYTIPSTVKHVGDASFLACEYLTDITIPYGVERIGMDTFAYCKKITNVVLPNSVTTVDPGGFLQCSSLRNAVLSTGMSVFTPFMFAGCANLVSVTIPSSIKAIGGTFAGSDAGPFGGCFSLSDIYYNGTKDEWNSITVINPNQEFLAATIHCVDSLLLEKPSPNKSNTLPVAEKQEKPIRIISAANLCANTNYILIISKSSDLSSMLSPDNLVFIDQALSRDDGQVFFSTLSNKNDNGYSIGIYGPEAKDTEIDIKTPVTITGVSSSASFVYTGHLQQGYAGTPTSAYTGKYDIHYSGRNSTVYDSTTPPKNVGDYFVTIKIPDNDAAYIGSIALDFSIIKAGQAIPSVPELENKTKDSITLKTIMPNASGAAAQYSRDDGLTWQNEPSFTGLTANTAYSFVARYAETQNHMASPASDGIKITTDKDTSGEADSGDSSSGASGGEPTGLPTVSVGEGGKAELSEDGSSLMITPDKRYELLSISVNGKAVDIPRDGILSGLQPGDMIDITFEKIFMDVISNEWYEDAIWYAYERGLMTGKGNRIFAPKGNLTRGELAQVLYNKEGRPTVFNSASFTDVAAGAWYEKAVAWANSRDIVAGYSNGKFGPKDDITRQQLAVMLWRYAGRPETSGSLEQFSDSNKVSAWAEAALKWAVENKIINGKGNGVLDPVGKATRAEVATMLKNFCEMMESTSAAETD